VREAHAVLDEAVVGVGVGRIDQHHAVDGQLDVALERDAVAVPEQPAARVLQQPAVAGDRVALQEAVEVFGLELEVLVPRIRQRVSRTRACRRGPTRTFLS
jgi:hypothetical protein